MTYQGIIARYRPLLGLPADATPITLQEGNTPLIPVPRFAKQAGIGADVFVKYEGLNPTGSFKDRGMSVAVTKAAHDGAEAVLCASTGNTSAAASAYAARAGMRAVVIVPHGNLALGKLSQALMHDAMVIALKGNFDDAMRIVGTLGERYPFALVNSVNPYRLEGQKTAAFEVVDALGDAPEYLFIPVGNAGNMTAYWMGFSECCKTERANTLPKMMGYQAAGAAPIVHGEPVSHPQTIATAIRIGDPANWHGALAARDESSGTIDAVTDQEIISAYQAIARNEGIFVEPASAAALAGLIKAARQGLVQRGTRVVCVLTGHGLKDPDQAISASKEVEMIDPTVEAAERVIARDQSLFRMLNAR